MHRRRTLAAAAAALGLLTGGWLLTQYRAARAWSRLEQCLIGEPLEANEDLQVRLRRVAMATPEPLAGRVDGSIHLSREVLEQWPARCAQSAGDLGGTLGLGIVNEDLRTAALSMQLSLEKAALIPATADALWAAASELWVEVRATDVAQPAPEPASPVVDPAAVQDWPLRGGRVGSGDPISRAPQPPGRVAFAIGSHWRCVADQGGGGPLSRLRCIESDQPSRPVPSSPDLLVFTTGGELIDFDGGRVAPCPQAHGKPRSWRMDARLLNRSTLRHQAVRRRMPALRLTPPKALAALANSARPGSTPSYFNALPCPE
jgi:hypothetical protein